MDFVLEKRQELGLTQKEFSQLLDIPIDVVKSWDCGRRKPPTWVSNLILFYLNAYSNSRSAGDSVALLNGERETRLDRL